jgi:hypothetical protein
VGLTRSKSACGAGPDAITRRPASG